MPFMLLNIGLWGEKNNCSTGWYKSLFEAAFDKPVKVKLKQSILQGADRCEFEIEFG